MIIPKPEKGIASSANATYDHASKQNVIGPECGIIAKDYSQCAKKPF